MILSILKEYGVGWAVNRTLYSMKLKMLSLAPFTESLYEKKVSSVERINIFEINTKVIQDFIRRLPADKQKELIFSADNACKGKIKAFSSVILDYGYPINWQLNPLTGKQCKATQKWYKILDFDLERGDIKVTWEISRFSHFITLARAFLLTNDLKYYEAFSEQLESWLKENPYSFGANYKCGQECALRMINGLLAYTIFQNVGVVKEKDQNNIKLLIERCYRKILSNFFYAYRCIKNNHTISELLGMIIGAWCCNDKKQLNKSYSLLNKVIDEQFFEDGGYRQYSFNYQRLALQDIECIFLLSKVTGKSLNKKNIDKIYKSVMLLYQCQSENGDVPNYGSNDGALIFPVTSCGYKDFRPVIGTIYRLIKGKSLYETGIYDEEYLWFSGEKIKEQFLEKVEKKSMQFPMAGLFTLRNENALAMVILNDYKSRPAHMDQLHFEFWKDDKNIFCDAGTFSYASTIGKQLSCTKEHNTVYLENTEQMSSKGAFMIFDWTKRNKYKYSSKNFCGEMISKNGYRHIRKINAIKNGYEIIDTVSASRDKKFEILFHTPYELELNNGQVFIKEKEDILCILETNMPVTLFDSVRSVFYLQKEKTNVISIQGAISDESLSIRTKINY